MKRSDITLIMIYKIDFNFSILLINSLILTSFLLRCIPATWKLKLWVYSWKKKLSQDLQMVTLSKKMVLGNLATEISELVVGCEWVSSWDYSTITGSEHVNSPTKEKPSSFLWIISLHFKCCSFSEENLNRDSFFAHCYAEESDELYWQFC